MVFRMSSLEEKIGAALSKIFLTIGFSIIVVILWINGDVLRLNLNNVMRTILKAIPQVGTR